MNAALISLGSIIIIALIILILGRLSTKNDKQLQKLMSFFRPEKPITSFQTNKKKLADLKVQVDALSFEDKAFLLRDILGSSYKALIVVNRQGITFDTLGTHPFDEDSDEKAKTTFG